MAETVLITLSDGTVLRNLTKNGDNFISRTEITEDIFENNLSPVTITADGTTITYEHAELIQSITFNNDWWFVIQPMSDAKLDAIKVRSDIEYLAMMMDIDLDVEE